MPPGVKMNCAKVKEQKQLRFTLVFLVNSTLRFLENLQPSQETFNFAQMLQGENVPANAAQLQEKIQKFGHWTWPGWFFWQRKWAIDLWKRSKSIRVFFSNFPTDTFAPQITKDRMCSIATFFSCLDFCLVWAVVAALNSWEQGREGCQDKGPREDRPRSILILIECH